MAAVERQCVGEHRGSYGFNADPAGCELCDEHEYLPGGAYGKMLGGDIRSGDIVHQPAAIGVGGDFDTTGDPSCCTFASLLGAPAVTMPVGLAANGLPVGMQLVGTGGEDSALLSVAAWCEAKLPRWKGLA